MLGTLLGVAGLLVSQQTTVRSVHDESIGPPNPAMPHIPIVRTTFERHELFAAPSSKEADRAWRSLMPYGDGFIIVNNSQALGLPPGIQHSNGESYDVSMFHQLHCLMRIRETLFITKLAINHTNAEKIEEDLIEPSMMHVYHCFDYIRQALMCAGDLTLEWPRTEKDGRRFAVDGWGVSHQCKSWEAISDYMALNRKQP
ncbi:hypothetical protein N431DRAFT_53420 [Stipitochalara longipes BDJ]|nr:hypothetical protein N431DRAFT_53420 [Stipitochalara longipes BDJ]